MTSAPLPPFKFRPRRESVDWRRIGAVDVQRLASELDVDALQEHVNAVTFCSVAGELCQRCQTPVDPALVKLFLLAQLTVEWLLHCQGYLTLNLRGAEERLAAAGRDREHLVAQQKKQEEKMRALGAELKQRKKIIRDQQSMFAPRLVTSQKCPCCEKAFMNSSFLQNHMQRRHPDEYEIQLRIDGDKKGQVDGFKQEISGLRQQLVQQQQTLQAKVVQEKEQQSMFKDMMRELDRFRAEDMVRMDRKIEDSRDGIRREMEFLYNKNLQDLNQVQIAQRDVPASPVHRQAERDLDNYKEIQTQAIQKLEQQLRKQDKKWESRIDEVKAQHASEKNLLLSELSVTRSSVSESEQRSHRLKQEMGRRLQEREHTITAQRQQIKNISSNPPTKVVEVPVIVTARPAPEPKSKKVQLDSSSLSERRPAVRRPEVRRAEVRRPEVKKQPVAAAPSTTTRSLRNNPHLKRELRPALEQALLEKLGELGVNPGQSGLRNKEYSALEAKVRAERESVARELPDYWRHREEVASVLEQRLRGRRRRGSDSALEPRDTTKHSTQVTQNRLWSSSLPSRLLVSGPAPAKRTKTPQPAPRTKTNTLPKTSTPNAKTSAPKTPPFSSDDESDEEEEERPVKQLCQDQRGKSPQPKPTPARTRKASPVLARQTQAKPLPGPGPQQHRGPGGVVTRTAVTEVDSDEGWSEVSEMQEIDPPKQLLGYRDQSGNMERKNTAKGSKISEITRQLEKQLAERAARRPAGGVSILPESKDMVQDLMYTDLEESSEWLVSSLEDGAGVPEPPKRDRGPGPLLRKSVDSPSTSVWGSSTGNNRQKSGLTEAGTGSTLKSSLSDFSDSDD